MNYQEFKSVIVEELKKYYGKGAKVEIVENFKVNGEKVEQVVVALEEDKDKAVPCFPLKRLYEKYKSEGISIQECADSIIYYREEDASIRDCKDKILDWNFVKERIYPVLINTEANKEMLSNLVSREWLDLSIIFMIREKMKGDGQWSIRISKNLWSTYGISMETLMNQAFENLKKDGYRLIDLEKTLTSCPEGECFVKKGLYVESSCVGNEGMFVLSNHESFWGAAKILNKDYMQKICGGKNLYILPSSVHETILMADSSKMSVGMIDGLIKEVNATQVLPEEVLSEHAYYYDAGKKEIRMAA